MVNDAEVKNSIKGRIRHAQRGGVSQEQVDTVTITSKLTLRLFNHRWIQVNGPHLARTEILHDKLHTNPAATPNLEGTVNGGLATQALKQRYLVHPLDS